LLLAFFATYVSDQTNRQIGHFEDLLLWNIPKCHAKQATLHTAYHRTAGSNPGSGKNEIIFPTRLGLHESWDGNCMPLQRAQKS